MSNLLNLEVNMNLINFFKKNQTEALYSDQWDPILFLSAKTFQEN